jgi:hypothetical protein
MRKRKSVSLAGATLIAMMQFGSSEVLAEARYDARGGKLDAYIWMEDARIDPVMYFVFPPGNLTGSNKCSTQIEKDRVQTFFNIFNSLVDEGVLNKLDVQIVWSMKYCLKNEDMIEELEVNRKTYFNRICKIRNVMRRAYDQRNDVVCGIVDGEALY